MFFHGDMIGDLKISFEEKTLSVYARYVENYLEENHAKDKDSKKSIIIDMFKFRTLTPFELGLYDNLIDNHDETHKLITRVAENWCGVCRDVYYNLPHSAKMNTTPFEKVNHHKKNKMLRLKGIVDNYQTFISIPTMFLFKCPSCGKEMRSKASIIPVCSDCGKKKIRYIDKELCSRMFFQLMEKTESFSSGLVRCFYELKEREYETYLFNSTYIGEEVEILGVARETEYIVQGKIEVRYVIELKGIKKLKLRNVTKKRKNEIIKIVKNEPEAFKHIALSMSSRIYGQQILRQLALATAIGLQKPDLDMGEDKNTAFNQLWIGEPSVGKSYVAKQFLRYFQKSKYLQGVSTRAAGLLGGCDKVKDGGFIIRTGQVQKSNNSFLIIDELDKIGEDAQKGLFTALSEGRHTLTNITGTTEFEYNTGFILIANPKGGIFDTHTAKYAQIDLDPAFLSRADVVTIVEKPYLDEDGKVDETKWNEYVKFQSGRAKYKQHYDDNFLLDYAEVVKTVPNPRMTEEVQILMENYFTKKRKLATSVTDYDDAQNLQKKAIDERFMNSLQKLIKIIGRALFLDKVTKTQFDMACDLLEKGMLDMLIKKGMENLRATEEKIAEAHKTTIPISKSEKIRELEYLIPVKTPIEFMDLVKKANNIGISEREVDDFIVILSRNGDITEKPRGCYFRIF